MKISNLSKFPLLRNLVVFQLVSIASALILSIGLFQLASHAQSQEILERKIGVLRAELQAQQERWRTWKSMGLGDALNRDIGQFILAQPFSKIAVVDPSLTGGVNEAEGTIVIGPSTKDDLQYSVVAVVDKSRIPELHGFWSLTAFLILALGLLFASSVAVSAFYIRRKIYFPLQGLNQAFLEVRAGSRLDTSKIEAWGEIREFIQGIKSVYDKAQESEKHAAVARMTEMLAHDVRKPFSILRMGLGMLGSAKDPASVKNVLGKLVPEIDKAVSSVDGLIADVMEVGSTSNQLIQEPASPESLIEATRGETFRIYPKASISIIYDLSHTHMVNVHVQKIGRVFSNIVGNAVQAMGRKGELWFRTKEREGMVEFCLGNAGSSIPADSIPKLFDAFFTSGKKGGTGLGLAIAEKVVKAHGGKIWCESRKSAEFPEGMVEFYFTLPTANGHHSKTTASLPIHSAAIAKALLTIADTSGEGGIDKGELTLEADIVQAREKLGRPLRVLVVDDEAVYRSALAADLSRSSELGSAIEVVQADDYQAALQAIQHADSPEEGLWAPTGTPFDLVITDVDMGADSLNGFDLVRAMRDRGVDALICVHSNRIVAADHKTAMLAGADAFLPKPMARAQLLRLALQAAQKQTPKAEPPVVEPQRQGATAAAVPNKPEVLIVDDNPFVLDAWADTLNAEATVHMVTSLEQLTERLAADPEFVGRLSCVVTDMHLDGSAGDGLDVGRLLKRHRPELRVLLSSDGVIPASELVGAIDLAIGKDPVGLSSLTML